MIGSTIVIEPVTIFHGSHLNLPKISHAMNA
jgi:hypothetical protein